VLVHEPRSLAISREREPKCGTRACYTRKGCPRLPDGCIERLSSPPESQEGERLRVMLDDQNKLFASLSSAWAVGERMQFPALAN
jgi:hypothetical protein